VIMRPLNDLQAHRCRLHVEGKRPSWILYAVHNLDRDMWYFGKHQHTQRQQFELSSYFGSGKVIQRWKDCGDRLLKGIVMFSSKADVKRDERDLIAHARQRLGPKVMNLDAAEKKIWLRLEQSAREDKASEELMQRSLNAEQKEQPPC